MSNANTVQKIDLDQLDWRGSREFFESLSDELRRLDDKDERYDFTWVGKRKSIIEAGAPINKTLRPDVDASKNWETTKNLFIEGDNLDALKLLQESYLGRVKMIYIDPPYNTGKDFVYHDNFKATTEQYDEDTQYKDDDGNIQFKKNERSNGRYHSDWLSMMYPRLKLARNLLSDDGVIFISIDDNEQANLKKLCDDVFGEDNFVNTIIWHYGKMSNENRKLPNNHEYILVYGKTNNSKILGTKKEDSEYRNRYLRVVKSDNTVRYGDLKLSSDNLVLGRIKKKLAEYNKSELSDNDILFNFNDEYKSHSDTIYISTIKGNAEENVKVFDTGQKPLRLIELLLNFTDKPSDDKEYNVLDFFSGSGTTAHAVMQLNAQDGGTRKWIMVQLPEVTPQNSEARKAGYNTIAEIARERIRRSGDKIAAEHPEAKVDYGFRALTIADSNYKDVYKPANETTQEHLFDTVDNIKPDRSDLDLLYGVLTATAWELNKPLQTIELAGATVYKYDYFTEICGLVACFTDKISEETIKQIAQLKPLTAVFRESSFPDSQAKVNLAEHFRVLSPETKLTVI